MNSKLYKNIFVLILSIQSLVLFPQNFDKLGDKSSTSLHGGVQFNTVYYNAIELIPRRDPFNWYFNGNLNLTIMDWSVPISYSFSNRKGQFSQPFNQYGMSPKYKNTTVHLGYQSPTFSNYTLSGYPILGAGIEYQPKHFHLHALYGRIKKEVAYDFGTLNDDEIAFRRMGIGILFGLDFDKIKLKLNGFRSWDLQNSLSFIPQNARLQPEENNCASIQISLNPLKKINLEMELAGTQYYSISTEIVHQTQNQKIKNKIIPAGRVGLNYNLSKFQLGLVYERTEPNYRTHGMYFMNNDFENIQLVPKFNLLKNALQVALNIGLQRNNLYNYHQNGAIRRIYSVQANWKAKKHYGINANYSNFNTFTRTVQQNFIYNLLPNEDTLKFYQVSQNAQVMQSLQFDKNILAHQIILNYNLQEAKQVENFNSQQQVMQNFNLSYQINHKKNKTSVGVLLNYLKNNSKSTVASMYGPGLQMSKHFINGQLRLQFIASYNRNVIQHKTDKEIVQARMSFQVAPKLKQSKLGKPNFQINAIAMQTIPQNKIMSKTEITIMSNLGWSF